MTPFVVFALPRSRTAWLSRFLSYREWHCGHEELRHVRSLDDVKSWLSQPNTGTAETAAAPWWRTLAELQPDARVVVVRRPVPEVVASLVRLGGDASVLLPAMTRLDHKLDQIERRLPGALSVQFSDLANEAACARIFEHCLPYAHDPKWWATWAATNVQVNFPALVRYVNAHWPQLKKVAEQAACLTRAKLTVKLREPAELTIREDDFETFYAESQTALRQHLVAVDEAPDAFQHKNLDVFRALDRAGVLQILTARSNGRVFGYLMTLVAPSLERAGETVAMHTAFFASPEFPGLGRQLQLAAKERLVERGVNELILRAGERGDGPRMGALYRRLGATDHGQLFKLQLH